MNTPNAAQAEAWGGDMGDRWVRLDADLERLMAQVQDALLARADLRPGERVLDIGCGSGALSRGAAEAVGPDGHVTGLDISEPLLALAKDRAPDHVLAVHGDAQVFDFEGARFDAMLSRFGVMFFDDPTLAFKNIRRGLAPGARIVMACWAAAEANPWFRDPKAAAEARLGPMPPADPTRPEAPGPLAFRDPERVHEILADAGFEKPGVETLDLELGHPDGWAAMERMLPAIGPVPGVMREKGGGDDDLAAILADLRTRWDGYTSDAGIVMPARVHIYTARNPD